MYCSRCKTTEGAFVKVAKSGTRQLYHCRPCNTARLKKYRASANGSARARVATARSIKKHQAKQDARDLLNKAIKAGSIIRPELCVVCGKETLCNGHHEDYTKPYEVLWVCRGCHADIHRKKKTNVLGGV